MSTKRKATNDTFLADQVHRIRQLVEQLALIQKDVWDNSEDVRRSRADQSKGPLEAVRDYRTYDSPHERLPRRSQHRHGPARATAHHSKPRKRRN